MLLAERTIVHSLEQIKHSRDLQAFGVAALSALPEFKTLDARLDALSDHSMEAILGATQPLAKDSSWFKNQLARWLDQHAENLVFAPPIRNPSATSAVGAIFSDLPLYDHRLVAIVAQVINESAAARRRAAGPGRSVTFTGRPSLITVISDHEVSFRMWRIPPVDDLADISQLRCSEGELIRMSKGESMLLDGRQGAVSVVTISGPVTLLHAVDRHNAAPVMIEFDVATSAPRKIRPVEKSAERVRLLTTALRLFGVEDRALLLAKFSSHPDFFIRWHAMRELVALKGTDAVDDLRRFLEVEQNPIVRRAADSTLTMLKSASEGA